MKKKREMDHSPSTNTLQSQALALRKFISTEIKCELPGEELWNMIHKYQPDYAESFMTEEHKWKAGEDKWKMYKFEQSQPI
ncbi:hypothetical protein FRX31_034769 [Thalictrum thalictroides]|uniref:Uncharacterized protein n=1 Tax=Thalictrum thalictroides TaxID=46969 RepID=A0A7J6UT70_THATH|nr:hypothetical protein FRX31_034769 [Thalictrum thalictroides]